jgi:hypothetical protein
MFVAVVVYTVPVASEQGLARLLPVFFGDIGTMDWPGQFNLDFLGMLMLSALWVSWRHQFTAAGLTLGVGALLLGAPFLCAYLLVTSLRVGGDVRKLLLGEARAAT